MDYNIFCLIINFLLYVFSLIFSFVIKKYLISFILCIYTESSIFSILLYLEDKKDYNLTLIPFIYIYFITIILLIPLFKFNNSKIEIKEENISNKIFYFFIIIAIINSLKAVFNIDSNSFYSFQDAYVENIYSDSKSIERSLSISVFSLFNYINGIFVYLSPFFLVYILSFNSSKKKYLLVEILFIIIAVSLLSTALLASRGNLIIFIIDFILLLIIFIKKIKIEKFLYIQFFSVISILFFILVLITFSRFSNSAIIKSDNPVKYSIYSYAGQAFLNFNDSIFWEKDYCTYGDCTFPFARFILGQKYSLNQNQMIANWNPPNFPTSLTNFITGIGAFVLDYGVIGTFFIAISISLSFCILFNYNKIKIDSLLLLYIYVQFIWTNVYLYRHLFFIGNLRIIIFVLLVLYLKILYKIKYKENENTYNNKI